MAPVTILGLTLTPIGWGVLAAYLFVSAIIFGCMCCDLNEGPFGAVLNFIDAIPDFIGRLVHRVLGKKYGGYVTRGFSRVTNYICNERNPLLQIFYLGVVLGAYGTIVVHAYPRLPCYFLPSWHKYTAFAAVVFCLWTWWKACTTNPGLITAGNVSLYERNYPFDNWLYLEGRPPCRTTGLFRPPRSKFCKFMGANVARFDHFCPWLNNAVGQENYRWFVGFLLAHCLLLVYGTLGMIGLLVSEAYEKQLFEAKFYNQRLGRPVSASYYVVVQYLIFQHWMIFGVGLLCGVMAIVLFGFFAYHLYLACRNLTTNETFKYSEMKRAFYKTKALQRQMEESEAEKAKAGEAESEAEGEASGTEKAVDDNRADSVAANATNRVTNNAAIEDSGEDSEGKDSEDEEAPHRTLPEELPKNLYDNGIVANIYEVLVPFSRRKGGINPFHDVPLPASKAKTAGAPKKVSAKSGKGRKRGKGGKKAPSSDEKSVVDNEEDEPLPENFSSPSSFIRNGTSAKCSREDNVNFPLVGRSSPSPTNLGDSTNGSPDTSSKARRRRGGKSGKAK